MIRDPFAQRSRCPVSLSRSTNCTSSCFVTGSWGRSSLPVGSIWRRICARAGDIVWRVFGTLCSASFRWWCASYSPRGSVRIVGPKLASSILVRALKNLELSDPRLGRGIFRRPSSHGRGSIVEPTMEYSGGSDRFLGHWVLGLNATVMTRAVSTTVTGGAKTSADLFAGPGWSDSIWACLLSQVRRWLAFCDE